MLTKAQQKLIGEVITQALSEVYSIRLPLKSAKQIEFVKLAVERIKQLSKEKKI